MPAINVRIEWDRPDEQWRLNLDNVSLALSAYCENTQFWVDAIPDWILWSERIPQPGEAAFTIFKNMIDKTLVLVPGTAIQGQYWYDNEPVAWMPFPGIPEDIANVYPEYKKSC